MTNRNWFDSIFILYLVPCGFFRFVCFFPFAAYWSYASTHWDVIERYAILSKGLYDPAIAAGEQIASNWGTFAFYWNFAVWIPSFWLIPPLNFPFMVIDIATTIYLSRATHYQTGYAPHSISACNKGAAYTWHRPAGANESFFEAAGRLNSTVASPKKMCTSFVKEWQYGIALSFFYAMISLLNIIAFVGAMLSARKRGESFKDLFFVVLQRVWAFTLEIPKIIAWILLGIVYYLPEAIFRCFPHALTSKVRLGRRYAFKTGLSVEQKAELQVEELKDMYKQNKNRGSERYHGSGGQEVSLSQFLGIYDMLMAVTEHLHYSEIIHLSRVSKSVRDSVLPAHDFARRLETFRRYTCATTGRKKDCWTCGKQVCSDCQQLPLVPQSTLLHHTHCRLYCTPCYTSTVLTRRPPQRLKAPHCTCAPLPGQPNILMRFLYGSKRYETGQAALRKIPLLVCRECNLHSADELLSIFERKKKDQLLKGLRGDGSVWKRCGGPCGKVLGKGPRWWVCGDVTCRRECRSVVHKAWGWREVKGGEDVEIEVV